MAETEHDTEKDMKTYIGVKVIEAMPCRYYEFLAKYKSKAYRDTVQPTSEDQDGYIVKYPPDGYVSWSPKDVFEAAYRVIPKKRKEETLSKILRVVEAEAKNAWKAEDASWSQDVVCEVCGKTLAKKGDPYSKDFQAALFRNRLEVKDEKTGEILWSEPLDPIRVVCCDHTESKPSPKVITKKHITLSQLISCVKSFPSDCKSLETRYCTWIEKLIVNYCEGRKHQI